MWEFSRLTKEDMDRYDTSTRMMIINAIDSAHGMNIGTGLKEYLESRINSFLPYGDKYEFKFNMSGGASNVIETSEGEWLYF